MPDTRPEIELDSAIESEQVDQLVVMGSITPTIN